MGEVNNRSKGKIASKNNSKSSEQNQILLQLFLLAITAVLYYAVADSKDSKSNTGSRKSSSEEISVLKGGNGEVAGSKEVAADSLAENSLQKADLRESPKAESEPVPAEETERTENRDFNLNLEDFLQLDNLPLLSVGLFLNYSAFNYFSSCLLIFLFQNGATGEGNQSSSRFSQWFRRDSPPDLTDSKRSTVYDELIKNIINGKVSVLK